jgi:tetratricopeptide (TPR) repeat protein
VCEALLIAGVLVCTGPAAAQDTGHEASIVDRVNRLQAQLAELEAQADERANDPEYYFELGNVHADLSQREAAMRAYETALELDESYVEVLVNLGAIKNEMGKADEAIELLTRASELRPEESKVWVNLGNAYYSKSDYYPAMQQYRKALEVDEGSYEAHYQIAVAYADAGIYREAIREWQKVVELAPESDAARSASENIEVVEQIIQRRL